MTAESGDAPSPLAAPATTRAPRPIRFCLLTTFYPPWSFGGDGMQVQRLAHLLADRGHQVTVVHSPEVHRRLARRPASGGSAHPGVEVVALEESLPSLIGTYLGGRPVRARQQLERVLAREFDVLHFHNPSLLGAPALFGMGMGLKLYTAHEQWLLCPSHVLWRRGGRVCEDPPCLSCELAHGRPPQLWRRLRPLEPYLRSLDALIAPSRASAELHRRFANAVPIRVLDHFVPEPADDHEGTDGDGARPYFLYAGRLEPVKGVQTLVEAFRGRSESLVIAGDGGLLRRLRRGAADLPHVRFTGWLTQPELDRLYRGALAVVVPTLGHESFGLVPVEAFARSTPAIVHGFGALRDLAEDTGGALSYRSTAELDVALDRIAADDGLRRELGARGRAAYERRFVPDAHLRDYLSLIAGLAEGRGERGLAARARTEAVSPA